MASGPKRVALAGLAVCLVALAASGTAAGAGASAVGLDPANRTVEGDTTATFDVVVEDAAGGVGAYNLTVAFPDTVVAAVTDVSVPNDPQLRDTSVDDGTVTVRVVGTDTEQTGSVRVATMRVRTVDGDATGEATLRVAALGDEAGNSYDVTATPGATLRVGQADDGDVPPGNGSAGNDTENGSAGGGFFPEPETTTATTTDASTPTSDDPTTTTTAGTSAVAPTTTERTADGESDGAAEMGEGDTAVSASGGTPGFGLPLTLAALTLVALLACRD